MNKDTPNIGIEKKIDAYLKGRLTEKKAQKLWVNLLKHPEYIDRLQTELDLTRYHNQAHSNNTGFRQYWKWFAATAAVVLIVAGINLFSNETLSDYSIDSIYAADNLLTASTVRSDDPNFDTVDSLLNLGFSNAIEGKIDKALSIYNEVITKYPETIYAGKAHLNIGILLYNKGEFKRSVDSFNNVLLIIEKDDYIREQAYWYMANALINVGKVKKAEEALQTTYHLNGVHRQHAMWLLTKLNEKAE